MFRIAAATVAILGLLGVWPGPREAWTQGTPGAQRIAVVVNEEAISVRDVEARMHLVIVSSALRDSGELRQRLRPQILRTLIDERLQLQEARRLKIPVSETEIKGALATIEQQNRLPPGGIETLFERTGIDRASLVDQIRATIAWNKLIRLRGGPAVQISEDEIDEAIADATANKDRPEYRISEIFLPVDTSDQEDDVRRLAERMIQQIRSGADFTSIARQFSQAGSAAVGGEVGWVRSNQMDPELERAVAAMKPGEVSEPVRTLGGFYVISLAEVVVPSQRSADTVLAMRQVLLPVPPGSDGSAQLAQATKISETAKKCTDMDDAARELKSPANPDLGRVKLGEMSPQLRPQVESLAVNQPTKPIKFTNVVLVLMVCDRIEPRQAAPDRDDVREQITRQRLDQQARRILRDLRRAAFVDLRG
ncbi:MAG: peptidyl-prolyl cis-trans isomerase [Alphaproteobacteria bacterium]|nr:peptidyl-prolyl cis-trans isomerase [Alphaproteobacteria bacterium]